MDESAHETGDVLGENDLTENNDVNAEQIQGDVNPEPAYNCEENALEPNADENVLDSDTVNHVQEENVLDSDTLNHVQEETGCIDVQNQVGHDHPDQYYQDPDLVPANQQCGDYEGLHDNTEDGRNYAPNETDEYHASNGRDAYVEDGGNYETSYHNGRTCDESLALFHDDLEVDRQVHASTRGSFMSVDTLSTASTSNDCLDSVTVVVRVRPLLAHEERRDKVSCVTHNKNSNSIVLETPTSTPKPFTFNRIFGPESSQADMFDNCGVRRLLDRALDGYACTVFAYGPTGSGKTHTITGPSTTSGGHTIPDFQSTGLIQRSFMYLFDQMLPPRNTEMQYSIRISYLEVYNERVKDLLNPASPESLKIRWTKLKGFHVENLFTLEAENMEDVLLMLDEGMRHRQVGVSNSNDRSSRSHCLLLVDVLSEGPAPDDPNVFIHRNGHITFVDLAGSEKLPKGSTVNLAETTNINKSLLALGNCISCLSDGKKKHGHIPYRESKLTQLLADSLGGSGITLIIACVSPSPVNLQESLNTLRYATRAKKIKNRPTVAMDPREKELLQIRREVQALRAENQFLRTQLNVPKEQTFTHLAKQSMKMRERRGDQLDSLQEGSMYEIVQAYMIENEKMRKDTSELIHTRNKLAHQLQEVSHENVRLIKKLEHSERFLLATPHPGRNLWANFEERRKDTQLPPIHVSPPQLNKSNVSPRFHNGGLNQKSPRRACSDQHLDQPNDAPLRPPGKAKQHTGNHDLKKRCKGGGALSRSSPESRAMMALNNQLLQDIHHLDSEIEQYKHTVGMQMNGK